MIFGWSFSRDKQSDIIILILSLSAVCPRPTYLLSKMTPVIVALAISCDHTFLLGFAPFRMSRSSFQLSLLPNSGIYYLLSVGSSLSQTEQHTHYARSLLRMRLHLLHGDEHKLPLCVYVLCA